MKTLARISKETGMSLNRLRYSILRQGIVSDDKPEDCLGKSLHFGSEKESLIVNYLKTDHRRSENPTE